MLFEGLKEFLPVCYVQSVASEGLIFSGVASLSPDPATYFTFSRDNSAPYSDWCCVCVPKLMGEEPEQE